MIAGALVAWSIAGTGFANYDTAYSLVWGSDLAHGRTPDYGPTLAPTPHPLATLLGLALSPLGGAGAEDAVVVLAFLVLGVVAALTYLLGAHWFGPVAGAVAAAIVITREPVLSFGARAYLDLPYLAFVLAALLVGARRHTSGRLMHQIGASAAPIVRQQGSGAAVLVLLGLAGLLRPEAWLFAGAYALYVAWPGAEGARSLGASGWARPAAVRAFALAAAAPLIWLLSDWLIAGDPLHSLLDTRDNARDLQRKTGLDEVPITVPRRIGEILREPVLLGAVIGFAVAWRSGRRLPILAGALALAAFCVLAAAGLPILGRYLLLPAVVGAILCGAAVAHARWSAAVVGIALLAFLPAQIDRLERLNHNLGVQREIHDDLREIAKRIECTPVAVPTHRPIPLLALWEDIRPREILVGEAAPAILTPRTERVARNFLLDRTDPPIPPRDDILLGRSVNRSWILAIGCL